MRCVPGPTEADARTTLQDPCRATAPAPDTHRQTGAIARLECPPDARPPAHACCRHRIAAPVPESQSNAAQASGAGKIENLGTVSAKSARHCLRSRANESTTGVAAPPRMKLLHWGTGGPFARGCGGVRPGGAGRGSLTHSAASPFQLSKRAKNADPGAKGTPNNSCYDFAVSRGLIV
jgi:hypothetical protein